MASPPSPHSTRSFHFTGSSPHYREEDGYPCPWLCSPQAFLLAVSTPEVLPDSNSVQAINLPNFLLSTPEPDDPKKTSDAGDQKEYSLEEVSREENLRKIGKSRKRSKDKGDYTCIFVMGSLGGLGGPKD